MRTLFLLGILATLVIIAVKKPNQTAWDTAKELSSKAQTVLSDGGEPEVESITLEPSKEPLNKFDKAIKSAIESTKNQAPPSSSSSSSSSSSGITRRELISEGAKPVQENTPPPIAPVLTEEKPKSLAAIQGTNDWTDLPTITVKTRPKHTPENQPAPIVSKSETSEPSSYSDIKIYYENASKLLSEIK